MTATLAMYPFAGWRSATDSFWTDVREQMPELPPLAPWPGDPHREWHDPDLVLAQVCAWPLVTSLADILRPVGTFRYRTPDWSGDHYRSVVIARRELGPDPTLVAAVNGLGSLSGWISLAWWCGELVGARRWPGQVLLTGSHLASLEAVRTGAADVASMDAITFAHVQRDRAELMGDVRQIGAGPLVPCLPLVCPIGHDEDSAERLRVALATAAERPKSATATLMIAGFSPLGDADYAPVAGLAPAR